MLFQVATVEVVETVAIAPQPEEPSEVAIETIETPKKRAASPKKAAATAKKNPDPETPNKTVETLQKATETIKSTESSPKRDVTSSRKAGRKTSETEKLVPAKTTDDPVLSPRRSSRVRKATEKGKNIFDIFETKEAKPVEKVEKTREDKKGAKDTEKEKKMESQATPEKETKEDPEEMGRHTRSKKKLVTKKLELGDKKGQKETQPDESSVSVRVTRSGRKIEIPAVEPQKTQEKVSATRSKTCATNGTMRCRHQEYLSLNLAERPAESGFAKRRS